MRSNFRYYGYVSNICKVGVGRFQALDVVFAKMAIPALLGQGPLHPECRKYGWPAQSEPACVPDYAVCSATALSRMNNISSTIRRLLNFEFRPIKRISERTFDFPDTRCRQDAYFIPK